MSRGYTILPTLFMLLLVLCPAGAQNAGVTRVLEYSPAPGQSVNVLPLYEEGDTPQTMAAKCLAAFQENSSVTLGGYGGYVVVGFDHPIQNIVGSYDFRVKGNASRTSAEPGVVMVSVDANGNTLPDDAWYELAGSEYHRTDCLKNYSLTYSKPATPTSHIAWVDNQGEEGAIIYNATYHAQPYYPQWITDAQLTFSGTRVPNNATQLSVIPEYWSFEIYDYGYADNQSSLSDGSCFKIDWAVDAAGNSVELTAIDFVKIYTGVNQTCGWLGEVSTEVNGVEDLHPTVTATPTATTSPAPRIWYKAGMLNLEGVTAPTTLTLYSLVGGVVAEVAVGEGSGSYSLALAPAIYLVWCNGETLRLVVNE